MLILFFLFDGFGFAGFEGLAFAGFGFAMVLEVSVEKAFVSVLVSFWFRRLRFRRFRFRLACLFVSFMFSFWFQRFRGGGDVAALEIAAKPASRSSQRARPSRSSLAPEPYQGAVSKSRMPASRHSRTVATALA